MVIISMLNPFLIAGFSIVVVGLGWAFTRHDGFDENTTGPIIDGNGVEWLHYVAEDGRHVGENIGGYYKSVYGNVPVFVAETHDALMMLIDNYAQKHPLPGGLLI